MDDLYEVLRAGQLVVYGALGVLAVLQWRRRPSAPMAWLAATFGTLGAVIVASRFVPAAYDGTPLAIRALVVGLILFPYFLYRFTRTFGAPSRLIYSVANGVTGGLVAATFLVEIPASGQPRSSEFMAFLYLLVVQWVGLTIVVTVRLWRGGRGQPPVARRRMRLLAAGAFGMAAALVVAAFAPQRPDVGPEDVVGQVLALVSGPLFLVGFSPPAILRTWWRQRTAREMLPAELALMGATTPGEVGAIVLPQASDLMGGRGAVLASGDGEVIGRFALRDDEAQALARRALGSDGNHRKDGRDGGARLMAVPLQSGVLAVETTPFTPFFGRDETELLSRVGVLADLAMTRTMILERELRTAQQLREAQALAHIGSWEWDVATGEITWSPELFRIYGYEPGEVAPTTELAFSHLHPDDRDRVMEEVQRTVAGQEPSVSEYRIVLSDGEEKVVQTRGRSETADDGSVMRVVGTAQDVTARKREEEIRDQFIANAAHELRTPLTALLGFMQLLTERDALTPAQATSANAAVRRASDRLGTLVNNLLDLTKLRQGSVSVSFDRVDLVSVVNDVVAMAPPPEDREVHLHPAPGATALTDHQRLEQILVNLLTNAYRYGGRNIDVKVETGAGAARIVVTDDGPGVGPELVPHLFEPFSRGPDSAQVGGSGLGLAIAAATAEAIGGRLSYEPAAGGGSRFVLEMKAAT